MMQTLVIMSRTLEKDFSIIIVPTMFDKRVNAAIESHRRLVHDYGTDVWRGVIPVDTRFRDASLVNAPVSLVYPRARGVYAYQRLLDELDRRQG